ncbi:MAG: ABA4-like family protein, partial [Chloroflexota bacterium]
MDLETLFSISNLFIMPFWLLMIFLPFWSWTERIMKTYWPILPPAIIYLVVVAPMIGSVLLSLSNPTLDGVISLLSTPAGATVGWAHFLAFDLFVGRWAYLDSRQHSIPWYVTSPSLFFVLMLGPVG